TVLRGLGVSIALPLLEAMAPRTLYAASTVKPGAKGAKSSPRVMYCYVPNGVNIFDWIPKDNGSGYQLSPTLKVLEKHRDDFSVISGLSHPHVEGGHSGADTWLTGARLKAVPGKDYSNTISADQVIAEAIGSQTRFPSLELSDQSGTGAALNTHTLAFDRNGTPLPAENSPQRLFERLFVPEDASSREAILQLYAEKRSVLDNVLAEAKSLRAKLGASDQQKLDEYLASVRQTELRLQRQVEWIDVPKPEVSKDGLRLSSQSNVGLDRPAWLETMLDISYLAFATDTTRVITFEWSTESHGFGGTGESHHELSHHGGDAGMLAKLANIDRFHLKCLDRFLTKLKAAQEENTSLLDNTTIVYGSGMNNGERGGHLGTNLPLLLAGGKALGYKHGHHLAHDPAKNPPLSNLLLSTIQKMGVETNAFQDSSGTLTGVD
ncbi:MAG TPA: DUF1552 domain-containing protein, partial [Luteolibacter sp.]|nr:DUF1552 domain-containing protein [Luteolibacter sp.]